MTDKFSRELKDYTWSFYADTDVLQIKDSLGNLTEIKGKVPIFSLMRFLIRVAYRYTIKKKLPRIKSHAEKTDEDMVQETV